MDLPSSSKKPRKEFDDNESADHSDASDDRSMPNVLLPDQPTLQVLNNLPLEQLWTQAAGISDQWQALYKESLRKRTHLTLVINEPEECVSTVIDDVMAPFEGFFPANPYGDRKDNFLDYEFPGKAYTRLPLPDITYQVTSDLLKFFPQVETLEVVQKIANSSSLNCISFLIKSWLSTLNTVRIWTWWETGQNPSLLKVSHYSEFFESINRCQKLRHFTFYVDDQFLEQPQVQIEKPSNLLVVQIPVKWHFLSNLKTFQFSTTENPKKLVNYLIENGSGDNKSQVLQLGSKIELNSIPPLLLTDSQMQRFHSLYVKVLEIDELDRVYRATNLRHLNLEFATTSYELPEILKRLSTLIRLKHLKITFSQTVNSFNLTKEDVRAKLPRFRSLRLLILDFTTTTHEAFNSSHLGFIFPIVKKVELIHHLPICTTCQYDDAYKVDRPQLKQCIAHMMNDWKEQCPKLRYIKLQPNTVKQETKEDGEVVQYSSLTDCIDKF